jgi:hypothetical protein
MAGYPFAGIALKGLEPYAGKLARTVLRGRKLPGCAIEVPDATENETIKINKMKKTLQITIGVLLVTFCISCSTNKQIVSELNNDNSQSTPENNEGLNSTLKHIAYFDKDSLNRLKVVQKLDEEEALKHVAYFDSCATVRKLATEKINNEDYLKHIAYFDKDEDIRNIATNKISNESYLKHIAYFDKSPNVRKLATSKIESVEILSHIAKFDKDQEVKKTAIAILTKNKE